MSSKFDPALSEQEAAAFLGISPKTLKKGRSTGTGIGGEIPYYRYGARSIKYSLAELEAYKQAHRVEPGA